MQSIRWKHDGTYEVINELVPTEDYRLSKESGEPILQRLYRGIFPKWGASKGYGHDEIEFEWRNLTDQSFM